MQVILALLYSFSNLFIFGSVQDKWTHTCASAFNQMLYVTLVEVYEEKPSHADM